VQDTWKALERLARLLAVGARPVALPAVAREKGACAAGQQWRSEVGVSGVLAP
jgi:hypothetical protein